MKSWTAALGLGLAASMTSAVFVEFNRDLLALSGQRSSLASRFSFNTVDVEPLPHTLLSAANDYYGDDRIQCSLNMEKTNSGNSTVLLAISKCLNQSSIDLIEAWVSKVKAENMYYMDGGEKKEITFTTTLIPGQCEARSELEKSGREARKDVAEPIAESFLLSDGTDYRRSEQVLPGEVERIQAFGRFGRVLANMDDYGTAEPIAVIGFVNNEKSYAYVDQYETKLVHTNKFNFQICDGGENCEGKFENCVFLEESVDLFMYNPFTITRSFQCSKLADGIPVTYVDKDGNRQCFCTCTAGSEMQTDNYGGHSCVTVEPDTCPCTWSTHPFGFSLQNEENLKKCEFTDLATTSKIPVPFPSDSYVADYRANNMDKNIGEGGPHVDVVVTQLTSTVYDGATLNNLYVSHHEGEYVPEFPPTEIEMLNTIGSVRSDTVHSGSASRGPEVRTHYTWVDYQQHHKEKIDAITLTAYGKYELAVDAHDYTANGAQCLGCVSVVDHFRPQHTNQCPAHFCDTTTSSCATEPTAELTPDNIAKASGLVANFYKFQTDVKNDACSTQRCDVEEFEMKDFYEHDYSKHSMSYSQGMQCFDAAAVETAFASNELSTANPLVDASSATGATQSDTPVRPNQCKRCCRYETHLKELWTNYKCGYDYDLQFCDGLESESCALKQCLVLTGDMVATASASIKDEIRAESENIIAKLGGEGFQPLTQIHRVLQCSSFDGSDGICEYKASIQQLIDISAKNKYGGDDKTFTFWRYKITGDSKWRLWENIYEYTFKSAETKITVEAWTACGRSRRFFFYVHLHPHNDVKVCDVFKQMWYQTSASRAEIASDLCAYPGSDFAELTFDYQPNIGLKYSRQSLGVHVSSVKCDLTFKDRLPVTILDVVADSPDIVERYAIELQNQDHTEPKTPFTVSCTFTYTRYDGSELLHTCPMDFTIKDCKGPVIDLPEGECQWSDCAGNAKPGPFEACGGNIVRATATAGYMDTKEVECCQGCGERVPSVCMPILQLPDETKDIKRCVPQVPGDVYHQEPYGNNGYENGYYEEGGYTTQAQLFMAKAVAAHPTAAAATALFAASAMVAVVALVVVRRRRGQAAEAAVIVEDAYYPLLY